MKYQYDKNGIKILPPAKKRSYVIRTAPRPCWKVAYETQEEAEWRAAASHDLKGDFEAYKCNKCSKWHIGHSKYIFHKITEKGIL